MPLIDSIPALVRLFLVLGAVLWLMRLKLHIGWALLIGSVVMAALFGASPATFFKALAQAVTSSDTLFLVVLVVSILILSNAMTQFGQIERLIHHFRALVGESRIMLVVFPAVIGLLPMPGGAVFSAPMVHEASRHSAISQSTKTTINYWFRHIWEFWWPLYPGVIVAMALTQVDPGQFILHQLPMTLVALAAGYLVVLRHVRLPGKRAFRLSPANLRRFLIELLPVIVVVAAVLILGPLARRMGQRLNTDAIIVTRSPLLLGMAASIGWVVWFNRVDFGSFAKLFRNKGIWGMGGLVFGVMIFKEVLDASGAVTALKEDLLAYHIPLPVMVAILPFIAGVIVGIAVGFVGVSFPVVLALLHDSGISGPALVPWAGLAFCWGWAGMMASPVHLCLLLTRDYFESRLLTTYKEILPMVAIVLVASSILFWIYV